MYLSKIGSFKKKAQLSSWSVNLSEISFTLSLQHLLNKRVQKALERSPEIEDFLEFPFFNALCTTGDTWEV